MISTISRSADVTASTWSTSSMPRPGSTTRCPKRIVADIEALGLLDKVEPHTHQVPHGDRSGVPIEPWLTDQWYVDVKPLAERALDAVRRGQTRFVPQNWERTFFDWLENIQPWC